jgi:CBS domain-containing protein
MIFRDADCGAVPVLEDGVPAGVLTDRDVALALADHPDLVSRPVSEIMTRGVVSVSPDASLETVKEKLADEAVRRVLVTDSAARLLGIIGWADIAEHLPEQAVGQLVTETVEQPRRPAL